MTEQQPNDYEPTDQEAAEIMQSIEHDNQQQQQQDQHDADKGKGNREAAKYRTQLREVEAERDKLNEQLTTAREQILDTAIENSGTGVSAALVWELGHQPADMFNDDGTVNTDTVNNTVKNISERYQIQTVQDQPNPAQAIGATPPENEGEPLLFDSKRGI